MTCQIGVFHINWNILGKCGKLYLFVMDHTKWNVWHVETYSSRLVLGCDLMFVQYNYLPRLIKVLESVWIPLVFNKVQYDFLKCVICIIKVTVHVKLQNNCLLRCSTTFSRCVRWSVSHKNLNSPTQHNETEVNSVYLFCVCLI